MEALNSPSNLFYFFFLEKQEQCMKTIPFSPFFNTFFKFIPFIPHFISMRTLHRPANLMLSIICLSVFPQKIKQTNETPVCLSRALKSFRSSKVSGNVFVFHLFFIYCHIHWSCILLHCYCTGPDNSREGWGEHGKSRERGQSQGGRGQQSGAREAKNG